jgi:hypothetical protein
MPRVWARIWAGLRICCQREVRSVPGQSDNSASSRSAAAWKRETSP